MALYAIGDLHLSLGSEKPMDIFGGRWLHYMDKLREGLSVLTEDDTLVLCGDTSWGMTLPQSLPDFVWLSSLPGRKIIVKGNHDYWWSTAKKMTDFWAAQGCSGLSLLHNNCHFYNGTALCGTRGWFYEEDSQDIKIFNRELQRLTFSLDAAVKKQAAEIICFLHYPPLYEGYRCDEILDILRRYGVKRCYFGHLHGPACRRAVVGAVDGVEFLLISADYLNFKPICIAEA